jgi:hypothetical protein
VPLTAVTAGTLRSLADSTWPRSALYAQVDTALCKQGLAPYKRGVTGSNPVAPTSGKRAALSEARKILRQACHILAELGDDALSAA